MAGDQDVSRFAQQPIANPRRRVVRLKVAGCRKLCQRIAGPPERLGGLFRAKLAAVPHDRWHRTPRRRFRGKTLDLGTPLSRERTTKIDFGPDRFAVMNQE